MFSREEKRWIDRQNKAARTKLKKEDNARVNKLVGELDERYAGTIRQLSVTYLWQ